MVQAQYDYSKHWEEPVAQPPKVKKVKKTQKKVNLKRKIIINLTVFAFIYCLVLVFLCIKGATLGYQIVALENEIKFHESQNARLQYNIQESCALNIVENIAINELDMYKPDKHLSVAYAMPAVGAESGELKSDNDHIAKLEEKPLYKIYANLLLLAEKN